MATIKDIRFVLAELNISKGTSRYNKQQLLEVLNDEFYNNNDLVTSCSLPNTMADVTTMPTTTWCEDFEGSHCDITLHNEVVTRLKTVSLSEMLNEMNVTPTQPTIPQVTIDDDGFIVYTQDVIEWRNENITPIAAVHFTFDDGLCLGHSTPTLFDTYVMHNQAQPLVTDAQPSEQHDSELTRESFNEARELYPTPTRIANNYLHYICLVLAYVYATIYIGCQVTHNLVTVIARYIIARRLTSIITATLSSVTHKAQHVAT